MEHPGFFDRAAALPLAVLAEKTGAALTGDHAALIHDAKSLDAAGPDQVSFFDNVKYAAHFAATRAGACFVSPKFAGKAPEGVAILVTPEPYRAFAKALWLLYPDAGHPLAGFDAATAGVEAMRGGAVIHPSARLEEGVRIEAGAVVGAEANIGRGSVVAAGAVVGYRCAVGRDCYIGPRVTLTHALVGNSVVIHAGAAIGQDGFGFAMGSKGHFKVPQIGRVVIQDHVEIGANTTIDRGALKDTIIGEGAKIDNLVQIAHNVVIGRHCVIVAQTGIAGSTVLEDFVVMGGQSAAIGHIRIGAGSQIAAQTGVTHSLPPRGRWGGSPARPLKQWAREIALVKRLAGALSGRDVKKFAAAAEDDEAEDRR